MFKSIFSLLFTRVSFSLPRFSNNLVISYHGHFGHGGATAAFGGNRNLVGNAQLGGRKIERTHLGGAVAQCPCMDKPPELAPHQHIPLCHNFGTGVHIAKNDNIPFIINGSP